jgi:tRNA (guanine-N7-)-methyltransferase
VSAGRRRAAAGGSATDDEDPRRLLFYGRRQGRKLRPGRQRLVDELLPRLRVALPQSGKLDPFALFPSRPQKLWLEIGFGGGEHLAAQAARHPGIGFLGCEVFVNGIATLLAAIERERLGNVRLWPDDARMLLDALPDASIARVFLLFPDPWPKRRHAARRFIGPDNLERLARIMEAGGELRVASDDPGYVAWTLQHLRRHRDFRWCAARADDWRRPPEDWVPTRYEAKALAEGRKPAYLRFRRGARGQVESS